MRTAIRESIETIALAVFLVLLLQATVQNYRVEGPSMTPRLVNEDRVLVNKVVYTEIDLERVARFIPWLDAEPGETWRPFRPPSFGDIVVFKWPRDPTQNFVKRVIGVPGDRIRIASGTVFVNGIPLDEPYIGTESRQTIQERTIGPNAYYVLGDNRARSDDSRNWGEVDRSLIIGEVSLAYWPLDRFSALLAWPR